MTICKKSKHVANFSTSIDSATIERISDRLELLYGDRTHECLQRITSMLQNHENPESMQSRSGWDQRDVVLITYGDQIQQDDLPALDTLRDFLLSQRMDELVEIIHILPFCPYSSDDGFSVIDYRTIDPQSGDWSNIRAIGESFDLMFDLVLNHISSQSQWFQKYLLDVAPYNQFFIEIDPSQDLRKVVRPRSSPVLTAFETVGGTRHLWTTFSDDQLDLNYANMDVLCEILEIFLFYVRQGARIVRLDAIAYLWKRIDSTCIHLPETHAIVKLFRDLIDAAAPGVLLLTETNVPHKENISYFGDGDEAHLVYQFTLPPLLLYTLLSGNAQPFVSWLEGMEPPPIGSAFLNFTASHDGIGVRPLEGLIASQQLDWLVSQVKTRGGAVNTRQLPDGAHAPYELNITWYSALADIDDSGSQESIRRFLTSQAIMLSLRGLPAVYFHSLFGTQNDMHGMQVSGQARRINRKKYKLSDLTSLLNDPSSITHRVFVAFQRFLSVRRQQPAFHPDAEQFVLTDIPEWLIAFWRISPNEKQKLLVLANVSGSEQQLELKQFCDAGFKCELLTQRSLTSAKHLNIDPWGTGWLEAEPNLD